MNEIYIYSLIIGIGGIIGFWMYKVKQSSFQEQLQRVELEKQQMERQLVECQKEVEKLRFENVDWVREYAKLESENGFLKEKLDHHKVEITELQKQFTIQFENLAQRILEEKSEKFSTQNKQALETILSPLQEKIKVFEEKVHQSHQDALLTHASLKEQLVHLTSLNQKMNEETQNLTKALKSETKMQGNWGEVILERILEKSGLEKGREYETQNSFTNEDGKRLIPDVVIHLPEKKQIVVDAKVSLTAYERFVNAPSEEEKTAALKQHVVSIQKHISTLSDKEYFKLFPEQSPEFVLLFIPIETAFTAALTLDPQLYQTAFDKKIVLVTPTTLLATLQTINSLWQNKKQHENALEIARQAGNMYDKLVGFVTDLDQIGVQIQRTQNEYEKAKNKLYEGKGNLIHAAQKLKQLGVKTKKELP